MSRGESDINPRLGFKENLAHYNSGQNSGKCPTTPTTPIAKNWRDYEVNCMNIQLWGVIEFGKDGGGDPRATQIRRRTEDIAIMTYSFFERPILNSPYAYPGRHWELDEDGQPTNRIIAAVFCDRRGGFTHDNSANRDPTPPGVGRADEPAC